jgi:predicted acyl esterase
MSKRTTLGITLLGLTGTGAYLLRQQMVSRLLGLPPARYAVKAEENIPVPMPDGVLLMTDHYAPKATGNYPTILIRSAYGKGKEAGFVGLGMAF